MYSLYRAWLSLAPCGGLPSALPPLPPAALAAPLNLSTPAQLPGVPDVSLQVGPTMTQFSAHKAVLSTHSGYFKAALANHTGNGPIAVPNINVDEFSSLLTFMYTGYLDLNLANIYSILLATHILHMPRALEICRSFLLQTQTVDNRTSIATANTTATNIIKPIPSRKAMLPSQQIFAPAYTDLQKHEDTPFRSVAAVAVVDAGQPSTSTYHPPVTATAAAATAAASSSSVQDKQRTAEKKAGHHQQQQTMPSSERQKRRRSECGSAEKVVIDIACCDGPVRFHRVVNKNYGLQTTPGENQQHQQHQQQEHQQQQQQYEVQDQMNRNAAMNKAMTENIRGKQMPDENSQSTTGGPQSGGSAGGAGGGGGNETYTCLYCNHTFKSQYCYQKHARRHLNPVTVEAKAAGAAGTAGTVSGGTGGGAGAPREGGGAAAKREVKLLDMNVQYYPCKSCGSKFPSYYFVHKHRKLCHADEVAEGAAGGGGKGGAASAEGAGADRTPEGAANSDTQGTNGSHIDVEAINTDN